MFNNVEHASVEKSHTKNSLEKITPERIKEEASFSEARYFFGRHDDAIYAVNESIPRSSEPLQSFEKLAQPPEDLSVKGKEHALKMANEFFDQFDPEIDIIAIASSALARSRETAAIYLKVAKERGFEIKIIASDSVKIDNEDHVGPVNLLSKESYEKLDQNKKDLRKSKGQVPGALFDRQGGEAIRTMKSLSLDNIDQMFVEFIFHPHDYMKEVQKKYSGKIPEEYKEIWIQARQIIEADDRGGWGPNFLAHSDEIQALFDSYRKNHNPNEVPPHIASAKDMYEKNFRNTLGLMARYDEAIDKYEAQNPDKRVRILGLSHENQLLYFLNKEFDKVGADKGKMIGFKILKDEEDHKHFIACLPEKPNDPKEIEFPDLPSTYERIQDKSVRMSKKV